MPALGWSPSEFWNASLTEFFAAIDGFQEMHGGGDQKPAPMTRDDLERLKREHG